MKQTARRALYRKQAFPRRTRDDGRSGWRPDAAWTGSGFRVSQVPEGRRGDSSPRKGAARRNARQGLTGRVLTDLTHYLLGESIELRAEMEDRMKRPIGLLGTGPLSTGVPQIEAITTITIAKLAGAPLAEWKDTYATLHMWTQIVGKIRLALDAADQPLVGSRACT